MACTPDRTPDRAGDVVTGLVLTVYTDGACSGNGTPKAMSGCGVWFCKADDARNLSIVLPVPPHTNQRAELFAVLLAVQTALAEELPPAKLAIVSDSKYCVNGVNKWMDDWVAKDWTKKGDGKAVANRDVWERVWTCVQALKARGTVLDLSWVKGHRDDEHNNMADELATASIEGLTANAANETNKAGTTDMTATVRLAVVGSRTCTDEKVIHQHIANWCAQHNYAELEIVSGGAKGVDSAAASFAAKNDVALCELLPDWKRHGRGAGFKRNIDIVDRATHVLAIWDGQSKGTQHSMSLAKKQDKELTVVEM